MIKLSLNKHFCVVACTIIPVLSGCEYTVNKFWKDLESGEIEISESPNKSKISGEYFVEPFGNNKTIYQVTSAVLNAPVVSVANARAVASGKSLNIIAAQKNLTANISFNAGLYPDAGKPKPGAQATASLSKFIFDYGQTDRRLKLAALETKASTISAHTAFNQELIKLLNNFIILDGAEASLTIIKTDLSEYRDRELKIRTAFLSGMLSRADVLEVEAAKNRIDTQYEQIKLSKTQSERFLKTYLGRRYKNVVEEVSNLWASGYTLAHSKTNLNLELIAVKQSVTETEIELAKNSNKYRINANLSVNSPNPGTDSVSTFAGFSFIQPVLDGGQSLATTDKKNADLEVLRQEVQAAELERKLLLTSWENYKNFHQLNGQFLEERKKISENKITELERRFSAGQSDMVSLANAILASAEAEVAIVQHTTELMQKKLETASGLTQPCAVINICKDVKKLFSVK